jgi:hypothetical protein
MSFLIYAIRNQAVGYVVDSWTFAKTHPFLSLATLGLAPFIYGSGQSLLQLTQTVDRIGRNIIGSTSIKKLETNKGAMQSKASPRKWLFPFSCPIGWNPFLQLALFRTPSFNSYKIKLSPNHPCHKMSDILNVSLRPANLWLKSLFQGSTIDVVPPNHRGELLAFNSPHQKIVHFIEKNIRSNPNKIFKVSARGVPGYLGNQKINDLSEIYGLATYEMSYKEVLDIIDSQTIYLSSLLPKPFYAGLKEAMLKDGIITLPDSTLSDATQSLHTYLFLKKVDRDPKQYGFRDKNHFASFKELSFYQIGAMVVKSQNFHVLVDGDGKICPRKANTKDEINLIDGCGLRDFHYRTNLAPEAKKQIMTETFRAVLKAADSGFLVLPALGMGVWRGDPEIYWQALIDAIATTDTDIEKFFVNPIHGKTLYGAFAGSTGEEFQKMLEVAITKAPSSVEKGRLRKIYNLQNGKKDIVQLAYELKKEYPNKKISLVNASDPDVTLGFHVGEYTNNITNNHPSTTEEHYAALGTNILCFEGITKVHNDSKRIKQMFPGGECI